MLCVAVKPPRGGVMKKVTDKGVIRGAIALMFVIAAIIAAAIADLSAGAFVPALYILPAVAIIIAVVVARKGGWWRAISSTFITVAATIAATRVIPLWDHKLWYGWGTTASLLVIATAIAVITAMAVANDES